MPSRPSTEELWEGFAREDAEFFILTDRGASGAGFFELGEREAEQLLARAAPWLSGFDTAAEIGCGVGRLAIPMARRFRRVIAVDVSPTMLAKCAANCETRAVTNVDTLDAGAAEPGAFSADLVYSHLVFQHIEDFAAIERYLALTRSWLDGGGVASLQFDTRPVSPGYRLRGRVPEPLLPRSRRRGIRRIRRPRGTVLDALARARLSIVHEEAPNTDSNVFLAVPAR